MYIIVGLGNPGKKYENTRHNIGFITVDYIADELGIKINKSKNKALVGEGNISGQKVLLVKPQTYMNLSGEAVRELVSYYKIDLSNLIVIYDDIDIEKGAVRIRAKGSAGTHNGMRSVIYQLQDDNFPRVRIGIGNSEEIPLVNYVVGGFTKEEVSIMEDAVVRAAKGTISIIEDGIELAMSRYNGSN